MKTRLLTAAVTSALLLASGSALAISNNESNASIPFSFSNPGARNLAMGGAFLGAADDATAAYSNPAGLTRLGSEQQFAAEIRYYDMATPFAGGGSVSTGPLNLSGVRYGRADESLTNLSFIGWVLPRDNWALAFYRQQTVDLDQDYQTQPIFFEGQFAGNFIRPYTSSTDLDVVTYGASFATNLTDSLSAGVSINWQQFDLDSSVTRFNEDFSVRANQQTQRGDDNDIGYTFGLLYKGSDNVSIGFSYRSATDFQYRLQNLVFANPDFGINEDTFFADARTAFKTPDVIGVGISWRATDSLTLNLDVNRVGYSNLTEEVVDAFFQGGEFEQFSDPQILRSIEIDDQIEPRLGMEYAFANFSVPFNLRLGTWLEKRHTMSFNGDPDGLNFNDPLAAAASAVLFSSGDDEMHYSIGFGWAFPHFQLDFAYDASDALDTLSFSGVYRF